MVGPGGEAPSEGLEVEWLDLDRPQSATQVTPMPSDRPSWRMVATGVAIFVALLGAYGLGRSGGPPPELISSPTRAAATAIPTPAPPPPAPVSTPVPEALTELLGEGEIIAELALLDGSRAVLWCRESVPGTRIPPTLALLHLQPTIRFGEQLVSLEELARPWVPNGASWRGQVDTEGFGADGGGPSPAAQSEPEASVSDGQRCASCAPDRVTLATAGTVLYGDCEHGVPFRAGIVYIVASPAVVGQSPLAVHLDCGITSIHREGDRFRIDAEVPLVRGLTDARFRLPSVTLAHREGRFWADDLGLLDWACDVERSSQLGERHLIRNDPDPWIDYDVVESALGPIGVHGPLIIGLVDEQCSRLTRAWWGVSSQERETGTPIADVVELEVPAGEQDWVYTCQRE